MSVPLYTEMYLIWERFVITVMSSGLILITRDVFSMGARGALYPWFSETPILAPVFFLKI